MTTNPLHASPTTNVFIFAVMRSSDKCVIASYLRTRDLTIEGVRECVAGNAGIMAGKRYTSQGSTQSIHYSLDAQGRVFAMVTTPKYPPRIAFGCLDEFQQLFNKDLGMKAASAGEGSLSKAASALFRHLHDKYENPANVDKVAAVQDKIDVVKTTMKENIQQLLINEEKLERIETAAVHLNEQSANFQKGAKDLSNKMWWKMWKMRLLIGGLIIAVLLIIIVPVAVSDSSSSKK